MSCSSEHPAQLSEAAETRPALRRCNGIVGSAANWTVVQENFSLHADTRHLALLASTANSKLQVLLDCT